MKQFAVLVAEDDDGDYFIFERALKKAPFTQPVFRVRDGQTAVDYLAGGTPYSDRVTHPFPSLLLLDLKMPLKHGFDVLRWLRTEAPTTARLLPTIVLSSSNRCEDVERAYQLGANGFLTKATTVEGMVEMVRSIESFWVNQNCFSDRLTRS